MSTPAIRWDHLHRLTGRFGLFEHARFEEPRASHGYTTDDNARALVVLARSGGDAATIGPYLDFVLAARTADGWHNRMGAEGRWADRIGSDDSIARAVWGLTEVLAAGDEDERVIAAIDHGLRLASPHLRSTSYRLIAAALAHRSGMAAAERVMRAGVDSMPSPRPGTWMWPEARLTYANARIPEALIRAGTALDDERAVDRGLTMLECLVAVETGERGFSFTPVAGRGPGEGGPAFDQQPIEAWAMADACEAAAEADPSGRWSEFSERAARWFLGHNDLGLALYDSETGAGYDGLEVDGVNLNRGAESTLAALGSLLHLARAVGRRP